MALRALTRSDTFEYVSDKDPSKIKKTVPVDPEDPSKGTKVETVIEEGATVFGLRGLDVFLMAHIYDSASTLTGRPSSEDVDIATRVNKTNVDAVRFGLAYLKNFRDKKDVEVVVKHVKETVHGREYDVASDETMNALGIRLIAELADQVKNASEVTADDAKKSA